MSFTYGATILEHFRNPRNQGGLPEPDRVHEGFNPVCGDRIRIEVRLEDGVITAARFKGDACAICIAAASILTGMVEGLGRAAAAALDPDRLLAALGTEIPARRVQCALLPLEVLRGAVVGSTSAIVLAAGTASRFGGQKLLAPLAGQPLVRHVVENVLAAGIDDVVVVLGAAADAVRAGLAGLPVRFVANPDYHDGMSTSLRCGIRALGQAAAAALIVLGDQPTVTAELMRGVVAAQRETGRPVAAPYYAGVQGNPVVFAREVFAEIEALEGDRGAREVLQRDPGRVAAVHVAGAMPRDVDTREDYEELRG